jgi:hypothetical protein
VVFPLSKRRKRRNACGTGTSAAFFKASPAVASIGSDALKNADLSHSHGASDVSDALKRGFEGKGRKDAMTHHDPRRHHVIEVRFRGNPARYDLTINGVLWSEVEWSASRRRWCVQDAAGHCLAHVEHIHAEDVDAESAIRLAKRMIRDGRMPTPEEAAGQLRERQEAAEEATVIREVIYEPRAR